MPRLRAIHALLAPTAVIVLGCAGPGPAEGSHPEAGTGLDGTVADAAGTSDAGDDGSDGAAVARCLASTDGGHDASTNAICSDGSCLASNWAQWPMPNGPADVANGAPNLESYTVNGDGTVTDDRTGLTWQQATASSSYTWAGAQAYCTSLALSGLRDWRLPTFIELVSILDYSQSPPAISPTAFPGTPWVDYWSSTSSAGALTEAREVYFSSGDTGQDGVITGNYVRCARGPAGAPSPAIPPVRYTIGGGTVQDSKTGLTWQQGVSPQGLTWAEAKAYCANLGLSAAGGWRLPTAKELLTLVDVTRSTLPAIDCDAFPNASADREWSATPFAGSSAMAWAVDFQGGFPVSRAVSAPSFSRCVRR